MKTIRNLLTATAVSLLMASGTQAGIVNFDFVTITAGGISSADVNGVTGESHGSPSESWTANVTNTDFDGDGVNDDFSFDLIATTTAANGVSIWGQGVNISNGGRSNTSFGFGSEAITFSVGNISPVTTSLGETISFDGFDGAGAGLGSGAPHTATIDINGTTTNLSTSGAGFEFNQAPIDFAPVQTVTFGSATNSGASLSARTFDFQFSSALVVPEPSSMALFGMVGGLMTLRRRK